MHMIHRESQVTPPALSITFSKCQLPRQGLLENFQQNVVLQLTFQCLLFYLSDFTTHWKKKTNHYILWSLQPSIRNLYNISRASQCLNYFVSTLFSKQWVSGSAAGSAHTGTSIHCFFSPSLLSLRWSCCSPHGWFLNTQFTVTEGTRSLCPYLWC